MMARTLSWMARNEAAGVISKPLPKAFAWMRSRRPRSTSP